MWLVDQHFAYNMDSFKSLYIDDYDHEIIGCYEKTIVTFGPYEDPEKVWDGIFNAEARHRAVYIMPKPNG